MSMFAPSELQIDIFVTNAKPMMRVLSAHGAPSTDTLAPPNPRFVVDDAPRPREKRGHSPSNSVASSDTEDDGDSVVDLSYYESEVANDKGELGHDEHILDLTNFEDDDDTAMPGEAFLNVAVKEEGKKRRSIFRRSMVLNAKQEPDTNRMSYNRMSFYAPGNRSSMRLLDDGPSTPAMRSLAVPNIGEASSSRVQLQSPMSATTTLATPNSAAPLLGDRDRDSTPHFTFPPAPRQQARSPSPPVHSGNPRVSFAQSRSESPRPASTMSHWSDAHSLAALVSEAAAEEKLRLDLDEEEIYDISVVAERARAGKPIFQRILADEVESAKGSVIVGCCGPTSLNAVVRKSIAAQIDPARIRRGDYRGHISLVAEDFGY